MSAHLNPSGSWDVHLNLRNPPPTATPEAYEAADELVYGPVRDFPKNEEEHAVYKEKLFHGMTFALYRRLRDRSRVSIGIDPSLALRCVQYFSAKDRYIFHFWNWLTILSVPSFLYLGYYYKWWLGILLIVFVSPAIWKGNKKAALQVALLEVNENLIFFELLHSQGLILYKFDLPEAPKNQGRKLL